MPIYDKTFTSEKAFVETRQALIDNKIDFKELTSDGLRLQVFDLDASEEYFGGICDKHFLVDLTNTSNRTKVVAVKADSEISVLQFCNRVYERYLVTNPRYAEPGHDHCYAN